MVGHSLLYIEARLHLSPLRKSTRNMVLRKRNKGRLKDGKQSNLVTTWVSLEVRGKTKACHGPPVTRSTLFIYNKRSDRQCFPMELPPECEKGNNKIRYNEVCVDSTN